MSTIEPDLNERYERILRMNQRIVAIGEPIVMPTNPPMTQMTVGRSSSGLGNPVTTLYREVFNDEASWTDALFWYLLGNLSMAAIWWGWMH